jgi:hypothetical protein
VATSIQASNELIAANLQAILASNERLTCIEQVVESNNRFLETFGQDVKQLTKNMSQLTR